MSEFTSVFAGHICDMLAWGATVGHATASMNSYMVNFDRFCTTEFPEATSLTMEMATAWCRQNTPGHWDHSRSFAIRALGSYLQLVGVEAFVLPTAWIAKPERTLPHIFTDDELTAFLHATDSIISDKFHSFRAFRDYTIPVIFRLMLGAGLRPTEARLMPVGGIELDAGMALIEESKRNKDRRIPLSVDLIELLAKYEKLARAQRPDRQWFFEAPTGNPYSKAWLTWTYRRCCENAGGIAPDSTPYTLRHNYATRTLMRWVEEGRDIAAGLPYLAAYLGHENYSSTAWYIHLLPERLAATGLTSATGIIPEVKS